MRWDFGRGEAEQFRGWREGGGHTPRPGTGGTGKSSSLRRIGQGRRDISEKGAG